MKIGKLDIDGLYVISPEPKFDERGCFDRVFCQNELSSIRKDIVIRQINHSMTKHKGTIRGMHFQYPPHAEVKIIRCTRGSIFDVAIDIRKGSPTFLKWHSEILSGPNMNLFFVPEGFAHGFQALEDDTEIMYFNTSFYAKDAESALNYADPLIGIAWPLDVECISPKDAAHPFLDGRFGGIVF